MIDHPIFEHLPKGVWSKEKAFRYTPWRETPDSTLPVVWSLAQQVGDIEGAGDSSWSFLSGLPRDSKITQCVHFADGVSIEYERQGQIHTLELWSIHPAGIAGISSAPLQPRLDAITDQPEETENSSYLKTGSSQAFLTWKAREEGSQFLLFTGPPSETLDPQSITSLLDFDLKEDARSRYEKRLPFWTLWQEHQEAAKELHESVEALIFALRAPCQPFSSLWCEQEGGVLDVNAAYVQILAWMQVDATVSLELFRTVASMRTSDGRIPRSAEEGVETPDSATAWPLINQTAILLARKLEDTQALSSHLSKLHSALLRTLAYMDHSQNDIHSWQSPREALIPDIMDEDLATVDCSALLLAEIEAHEELIHLLGKDESTDLNSLLDTKKQIQENLSTVFFDKNSQSYRDRYMHGDPVTRITLSNVLPLLTGHPDAATANVIQQQLLSAKILKAQHGIRGWQQWDHDEFTAPVELPHQTLLTFLCEKSQERWTANLLRLWMDGLSKREYVDEGHPALRGAWTLRLHTLRHRPDQEQPQSVLVQWMEKRRWAVVGLPTAAILALVLGITFAFLGKKAPPRATIEAMVGLAGNHYRVEEYEDSKTVLTELLESNVRSPAVLDLMAKTYYQTDNFEQAEKYFTSLVTIDPRPQYRFNLALTMYRLGKTNEAQELYQTLMEEYTTLSPQLHDRAQHCLELINTKSPPQPLEREIITNG